MSQLNIFTGSKVCAYCGHGETKPGSPHLFDGFYDQDTQDLVCTSCKTIHYISKAERMGTIERMTENGQQLYRITAMTYSEMPVMI